MVIISMIMLVIITKIPILILILILVMDLHGTSRKPDIKALLGRGEAK